MRGTRRLEFRMTNVFFSESLNDANNGYVAVPNSSFEMFVNIF